MAILDDQDDREDLIHHLKAIKKLKEGKDRLIPWDEPLKQWGCRLVPGRHTGGSSERLFRCSPKVSSADPGVRAVAAGMTALDQTKGCVRPGWSIEESDADIREMRTGWQRDWDQ
ncbi:MAG: hypothetical protein V2B18_24690 [Pseudomonadota bacterium]